MELPAVLTGIKKHRKIFLSVFFIFVLAALLINYLTKPYYHFDFLVKTPNLIESEKTPLVSDVELRMMTKELASHIDNKNYEFIASRMNVTVQMFDNIKSIQSNYLQSKDKSNILEFAVDIYDTSRVDEIKKGILNFLNNNQFVEEKINSERNKLISLKNNFQGEIDKMNEPLSFLTSKTEETQTGLLKQVFTANLIAQKANLMEKIYNINLRLDDLQGFRVIQQPYIAERAGPYVWRSIIIAAILSFIVSVFIVSSLKLTRSADHSKS